jgi:hypothetical protein
MSIRKQTETELQNASDLPLYRDLSMDSLQEQRNLETGKIQTGSDLIAEAFGMRKSLRTEENLKMQSSSRKPSLKQKCFWK